MSFSINYTDYDVVEGEIALPKNSTSRFASPAAAGAGIQVLPQQGPPFTLTLTRHCAAADLDLEVAYATGMIGQIVQIVCRGVVYLWLPYQLRFVVLDVVVQRSSFALYAAGSRNGINYEYQPAGVIVANYTLQAVPF